MLSARKFATRHARAYERLYNLLEPSLLRVIKFLSKHSGGRFDPVVTRIEKHTKGFLFDCKMCGNCVLSSTGMTCPMNCPKTIRNGPCGGVRENGNCEVDPDMKCVWVEAWQGAQTMRGGAQIHTVQFAVDQTKQGSSAWLNMIKDAEQEATQTTASKVPGVTHE